MLFLHKKSPTPIDPWVALRHGGLNNLADPAIPGKCLVLFNVDIVQRDGVWHYIFEFDARNSLELGALAQVTGTKRRYPDDMNWKQWIGPGYTLISAAVREEILSMSQQEAHTDVVITGMREVPHGCANPNQGPNDWNQTIRPNDLLLTLPG